MNSIKKITISKNEINDYKDLILFKNTKLIDLRGNLHILFSSYDINVELCFGKDIFFSSLENFLESDKCYEYLIIDGLPLILKYSKNCTKLIFAKLWEIVYKKEINVIILDTTDILDNFYTNLI